MNKPLEANCWRLPCDYGLDYSKKILRVIIITLQLSCEIEDFVET